MQIIEQLKAQLTTAQTFAQATDNKASDFFRKNTYFPANEVRKIECVEMEDKGGREYPVIRIEGGITLSIRYIGSNYIGYRYEVKGGKVVLDKESLTTFNGKGSLIEAVRLISEKVATDYANADIKEVLAYVNTLLAGKFVHSRFVGLMLGQFKRRNAVQVYESNVPLCDLDLHEKAEDANLTLSPELQALLNSL